MLLSLRTSSLYFGVQYYGMDFLIQIQTGRSWNLDVAPDCHFGSHLLELLERV